MNHVHFQEKHREPIELLLQFIVTVTTGHFQQKFPNCCKTFVGHLNIHWLKHFCARNFEFQLSGGRVVWWRKTQTFYLLHGKGILFKSNTMSSQGPEPSTTNSSLYTDTLSGSPFVCLMLFCLVCVEVTYTDHNGLSPSFTNPTNVEQKFADVPHPLLLNFFSPFFWY